MELFLAIVFCAVFMPCLVVFGIIFSRPSDNPFERILGHLCLGGAVMVHAIGQLVLLDSESVPLLVGAQLAIGGVWCAMYACSFHVLKRTWLRRLQ